MSDEKSFGEKVIEVFAILQEKVGLGPDHTKEDSISSSCESDFSRNDGFNFPKEANYSVGTSNEIGNDVTEKRKKYGNVDSTSVLI